ncbi:ABC transporter substrate-binding protein [Paenibacillus macerans]|uniref:ABC transporter substrate-binding protein n=1 Tax=Paenibacillus macerans TaxID=44252 RepID=UPI00203E4871|nr:extracellular solute-binding protein [Paenibacillus macerans]MCM3699440.1 extracellular solute-binding protein [Paenibacillus macerans]
MGKSRRIVATVLCAVIMAILMAACGNKQNETNHSVSGNSGTNASQENVTISLLTDNTQEQVSAAKSVIAAFQAKYPYITVEHETRPGGSEGDNLVKTRIATGDLNDVFFYNSGSLLQSLAPEKNFVDLTNEPFMAHVMESYKPTVTVNGKIYGVPAGSTMAGGWFYNKKIYADLGLSVPKTWSELMANNEKIKEAGITPVIGSYKDSWTAQLIVLADYYNVQKQDPAFAENYSANKAKFADTPAALRSFEKLYEVNEKGYMNKDFQATTYDAGLKMLAEGKGAHYPMLSFAVPALEQNFPEKMGDIGFFAQPGDSADSNGLTIWLPAGAYAYKNSKHALEAKLFLEFLTTPEGISAWMNASKPTGPWPVNGIEVPDNVAQVVKDMLPYFESEETTAPALEFVSPLKGPNLPQITAEVGSGITSAKQGAENYDKDVKKQAQQLGLEGW